MAEWNVKKDLLWGLALTVGLIALFEVWKYVQSQTAANTAASQANSAENTEAAAGSGLAAQIANIGTNQGSALAEGSGASQVSSATSNGSTSNAISAGAQIGSLSGSDIASLFDNLGSVSNPVPLQATPIAVPPSVAGFSVGTGLSTTPPSRVSSVAAGGGGTTHLSSVN